ncbi:uncharacterized protein BP5553_01240 [Venustampulla echinocandica]|uniref:Uncharacterized protein n=1 Tax=Venustampulla echinocandica TaxID=2656787 RepID=A0A370U0G2_9HELO|nr:uncharacterized protein BP5553_01240 [Venustampulla echinocandica]RDL41261.1 hypothetical protein BP5553_01240 [Venustampulla echinocandica]
MDRDMSSSPDPLNDSPTYHGTTKSRRYSSPRKSLPAYSSSPKKQTFELDVGDQLTSQKIRVTVEAGDSESEDVYANYTNPNGRKRSSLLTTHAPRNRQMEQTTTTTVRVKGLSDTEGESQPVATPKKGRGRPRKSNGTPVPSKKRGRTSTPTRKASGRRSSILDLVDDDTSPDDFDIGSNAKLGNSRGTPRSRSKKGTPRKPTPTARKQLEADKLASNTPKKRGRPRRKALLPEDIQVLEDGIAHASDPEDAADPENEEALRPIDTNSPSKYSTIRSTTTVDGDQEDVLIARFYPGHETPRKTGWSSPKIVDTPAISNPDLDANYQSSNYHQFSSGEEEPLSPSQDGNGEDQHEDEDDIGQTREFDTIMESEEFSMISVDSVPSLWAHRSSPAGGIQVDVSAELAPSHSLLPTRDMETVDQGSTFRSISDDQLEEDPPQKRFQDPRLLSARSAQVEDSFSSIPPHVLKAATPAKKSHISKLQSNDNSVEDSFSDIAPEVLEAATPGRLLPDVRFLAATIKHGDDYEDSFSAIPSVVLDAATPAAKCQESVKSRDSRQGGSEPDKLKVIGSNSNLGSSRGQKHTSPRLLTPEETPSPLLESLDCSPTSTSKISSQFAAYVTKEGLENEPSISRSHMPSSPPALAPRIYDHSAHIRQHHQQNSSRVETPFITFSSPSLPPPIQQPGEQLSCSQESSESQRPTLSPIARAGRALQDLVVPSQSRSRSQSLGSPFKSPANRKSPSTVPESHPSPLRDPGEQPLPTLALSGNLSPFPLQNAEWGYTVRQDDPFHNTTLGSQQTSPEERGQYSLGLPGQRRLSDPTINNRFDTGSLQNDDAMSWQADEEIPIDNNPASMANIANSSVGAQRLSSDAAAYLPSTKSHNISAGVSIQNATTNFSQPVATGSDGENREYHQSDDADFDLLLETMNSSSTNASHPQEQPTDVVERPRRSKIPSPWRKNSRRLVYSDELSHISSSAIKTGHSHTRDIMSGAVPEFVTVRRIETGHQDSNDVDVMDLSGYQIPQKANFQPRARETGALDLSALLGDSPSKALPVLTTSSRNIPSQVERNLERSQPIETDWEKSSDPIENTLEDQEPFTPIPQKQGFRPRARSEVSEVFTSSPVKQPSFDLFGCVSKPPSRAPGDARSTSKPLVAKPATTGNIPVSRITPSGVPSAGYLYDGSSSVASNTEKENHDFARTLKWTENLELALADGHVPFQVSPTKSCLRSPLKTPFGNLGASNVSPSKGVTFVSSSPTPSSPLQLSATTWSNAHWSLLSSIVQAWKPQNQRFTGRHSSAGGSDSSTGRRRNSTRIISKLLGRRVHSEGNGMVLEQWHLEAVDEFRGQVPGWEEKVIALRVFSLLVGEERRMLRALEREAKSEASY